MLSGMSEMVIDDRRYHVEMDACITDLEVKDGWVEC